MAASRFVTVKAQRCHQNLQRLRHFWSQGTATSFVSEVFPALTEPLTPSWRVAIVTTRPTISSFEYADMIDTDPQARENLTSQLDIAEK
jgi:hypothetical protein